MNSIKLPKNAVPTNEEADIEKHLGMSAAKMTLLTACCTLIADTLAEIFSIPSAYFINDLHYMLYGCPESNPITDLLKDVLVYAGIKEEDGQHILMYGIRVGDALLRDRVGLEDLDVSTLAGADTYKGKTGMVALVYPALGKCHHEAPDPERAPNCGPGKLHHGLFYKEDAHVRMETYNRES